MRTFGAQHKPKVPLPETMRPLFDRLRNLLGRHGLARRLGVTPTVIEQLEHGGMATPPSVERVTAALAALVAT